MNIKFPIILFLLQLSCVWTTKTEDSSLGHFHAGMPRGYELDNVLNYSEVTKQGRTVGFFAIYILYFLLIVIAVAVAFGNIPLRHSGFGRSFDPEFFKIGDNFINHEKLDALTALVEKSIYVITKL